MPGRKPLPNNIKRLHGTDQPCRMNDNEPQPIASIPRAPSHLSKDAKTEWKRMSKTLYNLGLLTEIDRAALAAYCQAYGRWVESEKNVQKYGTVMISPDKGWPVQSPYLSIANKALEQMHKYLVEFGMTPSSRSKISVNKDGNKGDDFEEFLSDRRSTS